MQKSFVANHTSHYCKLVVMKHIVIDARIRKSSTGRYMDRLLEWLQKIDNNKYRYTLVLNSVDDWAPINDNFKVVRTNIKPYSFNILNQVTYARFLNKLRPDLVHFTITPQEPVFYFGKRVTTTHDLTMYRYARAGKLPTWVHWLRMKGYKFLFWQSHKSAKQIIVPTQFVRNDLIKLHPFTKNKIAVTLEASEPPLNNKPLKPQNINKQYILHVGSPLPHKNIERLIDAFEILKQTTGPNLKLILAGKKENFFNKLVTEKINQSKFRNDIIMPGFIGEAELKWLYENAECYVLPSLSEGFGLPGLEAMAHGCPLVSSNATCLPEVYGDGAHYFNPYSVEDMALKISEVLENKKLRTQLIKKSHQQIKKYSWKKMAEETLAVYENIIK